MAETDTAAALTLSNSTAVTIAVKAASETESAGQVFNPLFAYWIDDPLALPGTPVTGSVVRWSQQVTAPGSTLKIETSINNGASWDLAVNNGQVPRLSTGNTVAEQILARATFTRVAASDASPRLLSMQVQVSCDTSIYEYVPIAHGMIDKVGVQTTGGRGSGTSGPSQGAGVEGTGGGQVGGAPELTVHGVDLSKAISRNVWQQPFTIPAGTNYATAIQLMVQNRLPFQAQFSLASTTHVTPLLVFGMAADGGDPWQDIQELATAIGYETYFDPAGVLVFRPVPDPRQGTPVWTFDETANPTIVDVTRELTDEHTYNYVVVKGQSTSTAEGVYAVSFDNDPTSATYIYGPYGIKSIIVTLAQVYTAAQAQQAADALLLNSLGAAETVTLTTVPMPALEPGDVITVNVPDTKAAGTYLINGMTTPLSPAEGQQLTCYRQSSQH